MSHLRVKTTYNTEGPYGTTEKRTLYAHHNLSCDIVSIYDDDGSFLFAFPDTIDNNLWNAIARIGGGVFEGNSPDRKLVDGIEYMTFDDCKKIGL